MFERSFASLIRKEIIGLDTQVPLMNNGFTKYVNFDNAASTPAFKVSYYKVKKFLHWYSNVHRGAGFKSQIATKIYDDVHNIVANFIGADKDKNTTIFVKNTTEAINKLSYSLNLSDGDIVITTLMEHHSNILPWRNKAKVIYLQLNENGRLDLTDLKSKLEKYGKRVKLVAICGASNVTGYINPIHKIARVVHNYNSQLLVDAAQLIPHRPIDIKSNNNPEHIDYLAFSAHKMYAPFGTGVLVGPKDTFLQQGPDYSGGGTIKAVTLDDTIWANLPDKEEAGTPNIIGAVALGATIKFLEKIGFKKIVKHENKLLNYTLDQLQQLEEVKLYGAMKTGNAKKQVGVIPFNITSIPHSLVAAILANEAGIGVRNGCFCAHPYIHYLLGLTDKEINQSKKALAQEDYSQKPGLVRISFGSYNTTKEIDHLINTLQKIIKRQQSGFDLTKNYEFDSTSGEYMPKKDFNYDHFFKL
ncbi:selenocysteine lyase [Halobacteroides halobius DSM 5150]|uniref:Selenocysteine lyase n=1 Tax=Halobacteroides halobius (strain ATCC 35273 / DSM 5150 / MD-1) TaxID=748449 RepID=L0K504_HALHC|nr:aminotransferase class V-fold PLP-dependent enzyme [Halobacteroides halobius]AGB40332.1 selenocysteine lyase [Halobacteroides halobius DSM 5150]